MSKNSRGSGPKPVTPSAADPEAGGKLFDDLAVDSLFAALIRVPDPDIMLQQAGITRAQLRALESDSEIMAALETRRDAVIGTPWQLTVEGIPRSKQFGKRPDDPNVNFVWDELARVSDSVMRCAWHALPYGYSVGEVVYRQVDGGRVGLQRVTEKPMEWFNPTRDEQLTFVGTQGATQLQFNQVVDTSLKFILTRRNATYRQPYGEALLSRLYWPWFFRHNAWRFWQQFLELFGTPIVVGSTQNPKAFVQAVQKLGIQTVIGVAKGEEVKPVTQSAQGEFERFEVKVCEVIQRLILGQTLTSGTGGGHGTQALGAVHNEVREDKRVADLRMVTPALQTLVDALWALNAFPGPAPKVQMADNEGLETERARRDAALLTTGAVELSQAYFERTYDFEPGEVIVVSKSSTAPKPGDPKADPAAAKLGAIRQAAKILEAKLKAKKAAAAPQSVADAVIDLAIEQAGSAIDPELIRAAIREAKDAADLEHRLGLAMAEADGASFAAALEQALLACDLLGYVEG